MVDYIVGNDPILTPVILTQHTLVQHYGSSSTTAGGVLGKPAASHTTESIGLIHEPDGQSVRHGP
jgi:hypothetical protein